MGRALEEKELLSWVSEITSHAVVPGMVWKKQSEEFDNYGSKQKLIFWSPPVSQGHGLYSEGNRKP